jgi:HTH-type transcriptional regulator/antitoxin HigA
MTTAEEKKLYPLGDTDYAVAPGETLQELLEEQGLSQRDLARRAGVSPKHVNRLLQGLVPLSADVAVRLERVTETRPSSGTDLRQTTGRIWSESAPGCI